MLVIQIFVATALIAVILLQRSEGGGLGMGGGPSGFMTARGRSVLLSRTTAILAIVFFVLCLAMTIISGRMKSGSSVVDRLKINALNPDSLNIKPKAPPQPTVPANGQPANQTGGSFQARAPQVNTPPAQPAIPGPFGAPVASRAAPGPARVEITASGSVIKANHAASSAVGGKLESHGPVHFHHRRRGFIAR